MTSPHHPPHRPAHRLGTVAILTALAFGCTTIRSPVAVMSSGVPIREGSAEPQLALWLESANPVEPEEATAATARARAALEAALAGREVGDGSTILVVREQGVARTASNRSDQTAATVGLVVGAVVVVVALVWWLTKGGSGKGGDGAARPPPPARGFGLVGGPPLARSPALPVALAARPPPPRPGLVRPPRPPPPGRPPPVVLDQGPSVEVGVGLQLDPIPFEWPDEGGGFLGEPPEPGATERAGAAGVEAQAPAVAALLPPMPPPDLESRGFFDGDLLVLELTLVDRITGEPRWTKWVEEEADPCDAEAVRQVLDRAFLEARGWLPAP